AVAIVLASSVFTLVRTGGITGDGASDLHWRWTKTPEERLLAQAADEPAPIPSALKAAETRDKQLPREAGNEPTVPASTPAHVETPEKPAPAAATDEPKARETDSAGASMEAEWPGFRGPERDGIVHGVQIKTDWSASPPVQMWRRAIGPGWSSFAVR